MLNPTRAVFVLFCFTAGACATSSAGGGGEEPPGAAAAPKEFRVTVDVTTQGVGLYDLASGKALEVRSDADIQGVTRPAVWLEPSDPEIEFIAVTVAEPERFRLKKRGGQVIKDQVIKGASFIVTAADGERFQLQIIDYVAGDRQKASFVIQVTPLE